MVININQTERPCFKQRPIKSETDDNNAFLMCCFSKLEPIALYKAMNQNICCARTHRVDRTKIFVAREHRVDRTKIFVAREHTESIGYLEEVRFQRWRERCVFDDLTLQGRPDRRCSIKKIWPTECVRTKRRRRMEVSGKECSWRVDL